MAGNKFSGNRTTGKVKRRALLGNAGNEAPLSLRNLPTTEEVKTPEDRALRKPSAQAAMDQINAEASYNTYSNDKASGHLNELHQVLGMLHDATGNRDYQVMRNHTANLAELRNQHGFTLHEDIIGGVKDLGNRLASMGGTDIPDHAKDLHEKALDTVSNFVRTAEPAYEPTSTGYAGTRAKNPNRSSVAIEDDYRANMFDYAPHKEELPYLTSDGKAENWLKMMKETPFGRTALIRQGRMSDPEASRRKNKK